MAHSRQYTIDMCSGPILPKLLQFSVPLMLSLFLQLAFNAADTIIVGRFAGNIALAAVGSTAVIVSLYVTILSGLSTGCNVITAHFVGAKDGEGVHQAVNTSVLFAVVGGLLLALSGQLLTVWLLRIMQTPSNIIALAERYLRIYFLGVPFMMLYNVGAAILRAVGDTRRSFRILLVSGLLNVVLNLFFVVVLGMSVEGVAWATMISETLSAVLIMACLVTAQGDIHLSLSNLHGNRRLLLKILYVGGPAGLSGIFFALSNMVMQSSINLFGSTVIAGVSAAVSLESFGYTLLSAFHQAAISFTGQNMGAGKKERIRPVFFNCLLCSVVLALAFGALCAGCGPALLGLYTTDPAIVEAGMVRVWYAMVPYALYCPLDIAGGCLRGLGYSLLPTITTLLGICGLRVVWLQTVFRMPAFHTPMFIYLSYPISWGITSVIMACSLMVVLKKEKL